VGKPEASTNYVPGTSIRQPWFFLAEMKSFCFQPSVPCPFQKERYVGPTMYVRSLPITLTSRHGISDATLLNIHPAHTRGDSRGPDFHFSYPDGDTEYAKCMQPTVLVHRGMMITEASGCIRDLLHALSLLSECETYILCTHSALLRYINFVLFSRNRMKQFIHSRYVEQKVKQELWWSRKSLLFPPKSCRSRCRASDWLICHQ
jgi:hypothetical protein